MGFASWLPYCSDVAHRRPTNPNFARSLVISWAGYTIYTFTGLLPPDGILPRAKFTLRPSLRSPILAALVHGTPAAGISQTLRRDTRNGIRNFRRRRHLHVYSARGPSRWASAHIVVVYLFPATHFLTFVNRFSRMPQDAVCS